MVNLGPNWPPMVSNGTYNVFLEPTKLWIEGKITGLFPTSWTPELFSFSQLWTWTYHLNGALFKWIGHNKDKHDIINILIGSRYVTKVNEKWISEISRNTKDSSDTTDIISDTHAGISSDSWSDLRLAFWSGESFVDVDVGVRYWRQNV